MSVNLNLFAVLFVVFLVLKLCGVIAWPWLYVFLPLIAGAVIFVGILLLLFLAALIKD